MENAWPLGTTGIAVTIGKRVFGLSAEDGRVRWEHDAGADPRIEIACGHVVVLGGARLRCLRLSDGGLIWEQRVGFASGTLLCTEDTILVGGLGEVACYDHAGTRLWHNEFKGKGMGQVALALPGKSSQIDRTDG